MLEDPSGDLRAVRVCVVILRRGVTPFKNSVGTLSGRKSAIFVQQGTTPMATAGHPSGVSVAEGLLIGLSPAVA